MKNTTQQESISPNFHPSAPESNPNKLFNKQNAKLAAFVLTLVAAGYIAYDVMKSDEKPSEDDNFMPPIEEQASSSGESYTQDSTNTASTISNETVKINESAINAICTNTEECSEQQEIVKQYSENMTKYKAMNIADFEKLPDYERLAYGDFLIDINDSYEHFYGEGRVAHDFNVSPKSLSIESSGQDMLDNFTYRTQLTRLQSDIDITQPADSMFFFNNDNAQKLLSSIYAFKVFTINGEVSSIAAPSVYNKEKDSLSNRDESTWMSDKKTELETSKLVSVAEGGKKDHQRKLVKYTAEDNTVAYAVFEYVTYKSYDDSEKSNWILVNYYKDEKEVPKYYF